ncbi:MAG: helix-turn-helix transcriptional regulator [Synergistaceae bacterium]|nr:helix-turn-helix transcriptional regulator [Synergistaceae bacterium]
MINLTHIRTEAMVKICDALNCDITDIMGLER